MPAAAETIIPAFFRERTAVHREMKTDHIVVSPRADIIQEDEVGGPVYTLFEGWAVRYHAAARGRQILESCCPAI